MSYCNTCRKWNGPAAVPAGANTDHLCRCPTRAQLRILQVVPLTEERVREIVRDELAKAKAGDGVGAAAPSVPPSEKT